MQVIVIYNPKSGNASLDDIKKAFAARKTEPHYLAISSQQLNKTLRGAEPSTIVVAAGGDGTINSIVTKIRGTKLRLGVIPVGTLNHFAKALKIPLDLQKAVDAILDGHPQSVDIGVVNDHIFVNNSSIGVYPQSLLVRDEFGTLIGKWPAAFVGFLRAVIRPRRYHVEITLEGKQVTLRTPFVFVGNNEYKRGQPSFHERKSLNSGQLAVYVIKATSLIGIVRMLVHGLFTRKRQTADFMVYRTDACVIQTRHHRHIHIACDGEVLRTKTPLHYHSEPSSLQVIVP